MAKTTLRGLNQRLLRAKEQQRRLQHLNSLLEEARGRVKAEKSREKELAKILKREKSDVAKLEGISLTGLFYSVLGNKESKLEKEKAEFLAAKLKHEESRRCVDDAKADEAKILKQRVPVANADSDYRAVLKEKEAYIKSSDDPRSNELFEIAETTASLRANIKELKEATLAGSKASYALSKVSSALRSAGNWGTFDMLGGGTLTTMAKHSKIDQAKRHAHTAQLHLRHFQAEMADVGGHLRISLNIGGFSKFADFFFDGLLADWMVQSKINNAASSCARAQKELKTALRSCEKSQRDCEKQIEKLEKKKLSLLEKILA